jgi:hypothetical protein
VQSLPLEIFPTFIRAPTLNFHIHHSLLTQAERTSCTVPFLQRCSVEECFCLALAAVIEV